MKDKKVKRLHPKEELFCQYYARSGQSFGNARMSYSFAYEKKSDTQKQKEVCDVLAWRLLSKVHIYSRCEELMRERISDEILDSELEWVAKQRENLHAKVSAISEANKVRGRITQKIKHKFEGVDTETLKQRLADRITGSD